MEEIVEFDYDIDRLNGAECISSSLGNVKNELEIILKIFDAVLSMEESE